MLGHIYIITNKINGKQYVGQTSRDIYTRFDEHCFDKRSTSAIHAAIEKYGVNNFELKELETVPLEKLDEREQYWIQYYDTYRNGYNKNIGGNQSFRNCAALQIVENNFIFKSKECFVTIMSTLTSWGLTFLKQKVNDCLEDSSKDFFGYHFKEVLAYDEELTDIIDVENWVKTLKVKFGGQKVYCYELNKYFDTIGQAAKFLVDNNYYKGTSKVPIQALITSIGYNLKEETEKVDCVGGLHFYKIPETTKCQGSKTPFVKKAIYCPELDKKFDSQTEAANYFIDNQIWTGIKLKTARLRISDIIRGVFNEYKGYTFQTVEN